MALNVFPTTNLSWPVLKTPNWATRVQRSITGRELRVADYVIPLYTFTLTWELLRDKWDNRDVGGTTFDELRTIWNFYNGQQGPNIPFLFHDVNDNTTRALPSTPQVFNFAVGDGVTTHFQSLSCLLAPVIPTAIVSVYVGGVLLTPGIDWTIDLNTGIFTFTAAPGSGASIGWDANYDYIVRFASDALEAENFLWQRWGIRQLKLVSVLN